MIQTRSLFSGLGAAAPTGVQLGILKCLKCGVVTELEMDKLFNEIDAGNVEPNPAP